METVTTVEALAGLLRLNVRGLAPAKCGALALVKASAQLLKHCPDRSDTGHSFQTLAIWVRLLDPTVGDALVRRIADEARPLSDPQWLAPFNFDPDVSRAFPPASLLLGLIAVLPPGYSRMDEAWDYINNAAISLSVRHELDDCRGWLFGECSVSVREQLEARLSITEATNATCASLVGHLRTLAERARTEVVEERPSLQAARTRAIAQIDDVLKHVEALGVERTRLVRLRDYATHDCFRVAVLGEFKRGKSTLINALLELPDLMPADILPCTSALTEIRDGSERRYFMSDPERPSGFVPTTKDVFESQASQAATTRSKGLAIHGTSTTDHGTDVVSGPERMRRWKVEVPAHFLRRAFAALIDSPGLGEDPARDHVAKEEAGRADAAIIVFDATQLASLKEIELIDLLSSKLENIIFAVNRSDAIAEHEWPRLREHLIARLVVNNCKIPNDRVVFVSAKNAIEAVRAGDTSSIWRKRMSTLRQTVEDHLLQRSGAKKARVLSNKIQDAVTAGRLDVDKMLAHRRSALDQINRLTQAKAAAQAKFESAKIAIEAAAKEIARHDDGAARLFEAFMAAQDGIFANVDMKKDDWVTKHHPLTSPKRHVENVAEQAKRAILFEIQGWFERDGAKVLREVLEQKLEAGEKTASDLKAYLASALGKSGSDLDSLMEELKARALVDASAGVGSDLNGVDAVGRVVIGSMIATLVGYIVADIVLYYLLGVIGGFLNPILLAAAVLLGMAAWIVMGEDKVRAWIRGEVATKIREEFKKEKAREAVRKGLTDALRDAFARVADGFRRSADQLVHEAQFQEQRLHRDLEALKLREGSSEALNEEIARLDAAAAEARCAFDALEVVAREIRPPEPM